MGIQKFKNSKIQRLFREDLVSEAADTLGVEGVSGFIGDDTSLETESEKGEVSDDVKELVSCGFVEVIERREVAEFGGVDMRLSHLVAEIVHPFLRHLCLVDDECVLEVSAFDKSDTQERFYLADEAESACSGNLARVVGEVGEQGVLFAEDGTLEGNGDVHLVMVAGFDAHRVAVFGDIFDGFANDEDLLFGILFFESDALNLLDDEPCTTVEDRHFGCVHVDDAVVDAEGVECAQRVFDGRDLPFAPFEDGASFSTGDVVSESLMAGLSGQVDAAETDTCVGGRRVESRGHKQTCVQTDRTEGEAIF